jgi:hypothetical protein
MSTPPAYHTHATAVLFVRMNEAPKKGEKVLHTSTKKDSSEGAIIKQRYPVPLCGSIHALLSPPATAVAHS